MYLQFFFGMTNLRLAGESIDPGVYTVPARHSQGALTARSTEISRCGENYNLFSGLTRTIEMSPFQIVGYKKRSGLKLLVGVIFFVAAVYLPPPSVAQATANTPPDTQQQIKQLEEIVGALKQKVDAQQKQIEDLKRNGEQPQQRTDQSRNAAVVTGQAEVTSDAETNSETKKPSAQEAIVPASTPEGPLAFHYKKLLIRPGGFIAAESVFRTRNENSDMGSNFGGTPFDGTANANLSEFRFSSRATRFSLMLKTNYRNVDLTGYYEMDFFGVTAANAIKSNSYSDRMRQLWIRADTPGGWSLSAGQMWSLMVRHRQGLGTGQEESAPGDLIEGAFILGHVWQRQTAVRIVKGFHNKEWIAFAAENPETTYSASNLPLYEFGLNTSPNATSPYSDIIPFAEGIANGFATNRAPDLIAKAAWEPGWGHYEIKAIYRFFRTRNNGVNYDSYGTGVGWGTAMPITKKLDFITEGLVGEGIGRYSSGGGPDITIHPDGSPVPLKAALATAGFEYRPTRKLSTFVYEGNEYYQRAAYINSVGLGVGYGSPLIYNGNCELEVPVPGLPGCTAQNRDLNQVIGGFWYRFFSGPYGTFQVGANYEHVRRNTWYAVAGEPRGHDDIVLTSIRFVLP
jgi:hypothetical protein